MDQTVYATTTVNVRTGPGTEFDRVGKLVEGDSVKRIGVGNNGWSRVIYNDEVAYVHSDYLTEEVLFKNVEETVYATTAVNVRTGPGTEFERVGLLKEGDSVKRTGIGGNGWSRVVYNGEVAYVIGDYLTTKAPDNSKLLVGSWISVQREDVEEYGHATLYTNKMTFNADGTGIISDLDYTYYPDVAPEDTIDGWSVAGRSYETLTFTYTLKGNQLELRFPGGTDPSGDSCPPFTNTYTVSKLDKDTLVINDRFGTYISGNYSLKEICAKLNVNYSLPDPEKYV